MYRANVLLGRTFGGKYTIVEKIGEGGMGAVLRGVGDDGRWVAIKVLHPSLADDPAIRARFERETRMAAQIDHPNAVHVIDHGTEDGLPYLVMELVQGCELFDVLAREGRLAPARAAAIVVQICDALTTAHDRGIVHRDLKPENVMLTGDPGSPGGERVKLLDFGVAKHIMAFADAEDRAITIAGTIVGTPAYMSPEQCMGGVVDVRSDVYACGAVLYHLVTGHAPFEDDFPMQTLVRHVHEEPRPPSELVLGLDRDLEATILKALRKQPEDRHQGAHELWEELLAMLPRLAMNQGHPVAAPPRAPVAPPPRAPIALSPRGPVAPPPRAPIPLPMPARPVPLQMPARPVHLPTWWAGPANPWPAAAPAWGRPRAAADVRRTPRLCAPAGMRRWAPMIVGLAAAAGIGLGIVALTGAAAPRPVPARSATAPAP
jgi:serine/threonine protein kinase